jgi:hypothetical protein
MKEEGTIKVKILQGEMTCGQSKKALLVPRAADP